MEITEHNSEEKLNIMTPATLEGDTLGQKHRHFNKLVEDAITNTNYELRKISNDDSDIDNLLKIAIASKTRNVDYIIEVMKSNDMLYAATAIKKSTWLITEPQYADIINPEYLHTQLLPSMNTKTFNKLMLHIRLNLKDESRVEAFYEYLKGSEKSHKWLQNCSIPFIENVIKIKRHVPLSLLKRLCKRSAHFLDYCAFVELNRKSRVKQEILFLLKSHPTDVLNIVEDEKIFDYVPEIGKKKTEFLMKNYQQRVLDNFDKYGKKMELSVVAKYLNKNEIISFLCKHASILLGHRFFHDTLRHFIMNMPMELRFEIVKKTFIDKTEMALLFTDQERKNIERYIKPFQWYEHAPFEVALPDIQKLIRKENSSSERCAMLSVLITCTRKNPKHVTTLLKFVNERHMNEPFKFKIQFINDLLSQISVHEFDIETWNLLDQFFHSMDVYSESNNNVQLCLQSVTLFKVLKDKPVPEIIQQKMTFRTFKRFQNKLNQEQKSKIFTYLLNSVLKKVQSENIAQESDFMKTVDQMQNILILLRDWQKDINNYPIILQKIQVLIKIQQENKWKADMSCLYNVKKSWRRHLFEESLSLCLSEEVCLNVLKHKPQLLILHDNEIDSLRTNDAVSLRRLLAKLRVYWPHSLAQHWTNAYFLKLNQPAGQKAVVKGLFMLLSQNKIVALAKNQAPKNFKITWGETGQTEISIQKNIAKNLHIARPLIPLDTILLYANGDYLQYAVPSLNAILCNINEVKSRDHLPKLLNASISLQKFGLHLAYLKLKPDALKSIFAKIWKTTTNLTIRAVIFKHLLDKICKVRNPTIEKELWELICIFINELHSGESTEIYKKLGNVETVPINIRAEYFIKSYEFLTSLPASANCEKYVKNLIKYAPKIINNLDEDFICNKLLCHAGYKFCLYESEYIEVFACYVLFGKSEENQVQRFSKVVGPALKEAFQCWGNKRSGEYYIRNNFDRFLRHMLASFTKHVTLNNIPIPVKLFVEIKINIEQNLSVLENYVMNTSWKLITEYVNLVHKHATSESPFGSNKWTELDFTDRWKPSGVEDLWKDINLKIAPSFGPVIVKRLKEDIEKYSSTIYFVFSEALEAMFDKLYFHDNFFVLETLKNMLIDNDFVPSYLVVSKTVGKFCDNDKLRRMRLEIHKIVLSNPSETVLVHCYNDFHNIAED